MRSKARFPLMLLGLLAPVDRHVANFRGWSLWT
jgi:hypothetical protein